MKRNRIFLDFTTLLDITMIILFWFIIKSDASANEARTQAQEQIASIAAEAEQERIEFELEKENWRKEAESELERIKSADENAAKNQQALAGVEKGNIIHIQLDINEEQIPHIKVFYGKKNIGEFDINSAKDATGELISIFENAGFAKDSVMIGIFEYDGNQEGTASVMVSDPIERPIRAVSEEYPYFYCAVINISK